MTHGHPRTLLETSKLIAPVFTKPGFCNAIVVLVGWVLTQDRHAVTGALVAAGVAGLRHHAAFHRFFSRGTWSPDELGLLLLSKLLELCVCPGAVVELVLDDTLCRKKGPAIFGLGSHLDAVRSTKAFRVLSFGHVWVVLSVVVRLPFSNRPWALPVFFRLYRTKQDCNRRGHKDGRFYKKTELGRQMIDLVAQRLPTIRFRVSADDAYSNSTVLDDLPENFVFVGSMRSDAVLTALPTADEHKKAGRRRLRGERLPKPEELVKARQPWTKVEAFIYGRWRTLQVKTIDAQWYRSAAERLLRIVVVRVDHGAVPMRVFFSTDPTMSVQLIIETYAGRWSTEACFRDLKQLLGFDESQARCKAAVERVAPFVGHIRTLLILWFLERAVGTPVAELPIRPWYRHKSGLCFADVLRAAQRSLAGADILDLLHDLDDLHPSRQTSANDPPTHQRQAA
jgi:hypothetical protein